MKIEKLKKYSNKKIAILGFGKEGKSTLDFLLKLGFLNIEILDSNKSINKINGLKYILGKQYLNNLGRFDLIFKTPGISPYNDKIEPFKEKLISGNDIFFENYNFKVIGITGTKGKSTISTLIYKVLKKIGYKVKLVGNIGVPVLSEIDIINGEKYDFIVYEISSYVLELLKPNLFISIINNIYDCHLDWHNGKTNYINAKLNIIKNAENILINDELKYLNKNLNSSFIFGKCGNYFYKNNAFYKNKNILFHNKNILLKGDHNKRNISAVIGVLDLINKKNISHNINILQNILAHFSGLESRIENIGIYKGITFINDAIATTPESTIVAIKTFGKNIGTILLGGTNSGFKFKKLINIILKHKIQNLILFPDTGINIFNEIKKQNLDNNFNIFKTTKMSEAIKFAFKNTHIGKICILSNAAPSFSLRSSYIEKGELFKKEIKKQALIKFNDKLISK